jgi:hypothetical protein
MRFVTLDGQQSIEVPSITIVILSQIVARSFSTPIKAPKSKRRRVHIQGKSASHSENTSCDGIQ